MHTITKLLSPYLFYGSQQVTVSGLIEGVNLAYTDGIMVSTFRERQEEISKSRNVPDVSEMVRRLVGDYWLSMIDDI